MIDELHAQDVALIKDVVIYPSEKLTCITGETGAGKTALLGALKLLVGERADSSLVRQTSDALSVEGRIFLDDGYKDGHVVRRRVSLEGRGRVNLDGHISTVGEVQRVVGNSVDLCGQHEHQKLLDQTEHINILDSFNQEEISQAKQAYEEAFDKKNKAQQTLDEIIKATTSSQEIVDQERFVLSRIEAVAPSFEELQEIEEKLPRAENAESLYRATDNCIDYLSSENSTQDLLVSAIDELESVSSYDKKLLELKNRLQSCLIDIEDIERELSGYRQTIDIDMSGLEYLQTRLASIQGLMRVYGPGIEEVMQRWAQAQEIVEAQDNSEEKIKSAKDALTKAEDELKAAARVLDDVRKKTAPQLSHAIQDQMSLLEMGASRVKFSFESLTFTSWTKQGPSKVELLYAPGKQMSFRPLAKIASGGEISRVMLAIKVVLGNKDNVDTLVFDEVDAGVGGATAKALAEVLKNLSLTHQTIVVTHLPQVAVMADCHLVVQKVGDTNPETKLFEVTGDSRVEEISRMLSGDTSEESLAHATKMLEDAKSV